MDEPTDEQYLRWLYSQVASVRVTNPTRTYWSLMRQLLEKEFAWFVPNDDNRAEDGKDLRHEFFRSRGITDPHPDWWTLGCSVLEMLVALTRRLSFEDDQDPKVWFWELMDNLGLSRYTDARFNSATARRTDDILDRLIWRTYEKDGQGGLFPLQHPKQDQRDVEIWYQLSAYLLERE